ncbi:MAG TPA: permease [Gammaproteobacteria bacterium]|nr:permease [Gammaproteobacteria bacterium]
MEPVATPINAMREKNCCVWIGPTHQATQQALGELQKAGFDLCQVSVVGKGYHSEEHPIGFYSRGDEIRYWGLQSDFWTGLWNLLAGAAFFWVPGFGPLAVAGPIAAVLVRGLDDVAIDGGFGVPGAALYSMGIPRSSIQQYEEAVRADRFLLIVHGGHRDVEHACSILHGETRQVTVHRA